MLIIHVHVEVHHTHKIHVYTCNIFHLRELMKPEEEDVTFDLPGSLGNKLDISREHSLRALSGSMMSPDSSRDGTSATGSESHLVICFTYNIYMPLHSVNELINLLGG